MSTKVAKLEDSTKAELIKLIQQMKLEVVEARKLMDRTDPDDSSLTHIGVALLIDKSANYSYIELKYNPETGAAKVSKRVDKGTAGHMAQRELQIELGNTIIKQLRELKG